MDLNSLSDEQLINLAKNGDNKASGVIVKRYDNLIKKIVRKYIYSGNDDLYQAGALGLCSAINNFDGVSIFENFAYICINNSIRSELRKNSTKKNQPLTDYVPLSGYGDGDSDKTVVLVDSSMGPEDVCLDNERKSEIEKNIEKILSELEYNIFALFLQDYSYTEIGARLGKDEKSVDNALQRIRKKLKQKLIF